MRLSVQKALSDAQQSAQGVRPLERKRRRRESRSSKYSCLETHRLQSRKDPAKVQDVVTDPERRQWRSLWGDQKNGWLDVWTKRLSWCWRVQHRAWSSLTSSMEMAKWMKHKLRTSLSSLRMQKTRWTPQMSSIVTSSWKTSSLKPAPWSLKSGSSISEAAALRPPWCTRASLEPLNLLFQKLLHVGSTRPTPPQFGSSGISSTKSSMVLILNRRNTSCGDKLIQGSLIVS
ncbi:uncharacterized protein LOC133497933 isoform X1 [Syngnathoides biaculeatus]|uniref:uncharacterized protein LOC133497933 isoform X1 n=1 Tax=Syngnathoides biaculeatus TaxID=300417 RepID=UPI002ADE2A6D|nr:uncharacterized protein LOC133497933 isoform X1 [Syngnathoides biaculeatus]